MPTPTSPAIHSAEANAAAALPMTAMPGGKGGACGVAGCEATPSGVHNGLAAAIRVYAASVESFTSAECVKAVGRAPKEVGRVLCAEVRRGRLYAYGSLGHGRRHYTVHKRLMDAYLAAGGEVHYVSQKRAQVRGAINSPRQQAFLDALRQRRQATTIELAPLIGMTGRVTSNVGARLVQKGVIWARPIHGRFFVYFSDKADAEAFVPPPVKQGRARAKVEMKPRVGRIQIKLLEALAVAGAAGMNATQAAAACREPRARVSASLAALAATGRAFTRRVGRFYWYFETQAFADTWSPPVKAPAPPKAPKVKATKPKSARAYAVTAEKPSIAPTVTVKNHGRVSPYGEAITPAHVKPVVCPPYTHNHRYQVAPGLVPFGAGFAAAGLGRYLEV